MQDTLAVPAPRLGPRRRGGLRLAPWRWLRGHREAVAIFGLALLAYVVAAWVVVFQLFIFVTDAMSRALDAQQVFLSARPTLTAVGFVWPPLPTILQVPLAIFPPLRVLGLSANLLTALMGAAALVVLNAIFKELDLRRLPRYAALLALGLNPMIVFYAANGMSEIVFIVFMLLSFLYLLRWYRTESLVALTLLGFSVGLAFLARYDAAVHGALLVPVLILLGRRKGFDGRRIQALVLAYALPAVYLPALWLWFNFQIMGDPLNFLRGEYSNAAQIGYQLALLPHLDELRGNLPAITVFVAQKIWELFPIFWIAVAVTLAYGALRRNGLALAFGALSLSFPIFQIMNLFQGQSAAFVRYFILAIPLGVLLLGYLISRIRWNTTWRSSLVGIALFGVLGAGGFASAAAMTANAAWGQWNDIFVDAVVNWRRVDTWSDERAIADYLMQHTDSREILVDDFQGYRIVFFSGDPGRFVVNVDPDFGEILGDPAGRVKNVLAPSRRLEGSLNQINITHPLLYELGAPWAALEKEWADSAGQWRLYRVKDIAD